MQKSFKVRLDALDALERQRSNNAIDWALAHLGQDELDRFVTFWHREQASPRIYPEAGAEAAAVERYCELAELAYAQGFLQKDMRF